MSLGRQPARARGPHSCSRRGLSYSDPKGSEAGPSPAEVPVRRSLARPRLLTPKLGDTNRAVAFAATTFVVTRVMCSMENGSTSQAPQPAGLRAGHWGSQSFAHEGGGLCTGRRGSDGHQAPACRVQGCQQPRQPLSPPGWWCCPRRPHRKEQSRRPTCRPSSALRGPTQPVCLRCRPPAPARPHCMPARRPAVSWETPSPRPPAPRPLLREHVRVRRVSGCVRACVCVRLRACTRVASLPRVCPSLGGFPDQ